MILSGREEKTDSVTKDHGGHRPPWHSQQPDMAELLDNLFQHQSLTGFSGAIGLKAQGFGWAPGTEEGISWHSESEEVWGEEGE